LHFVSSNSRQDFFHKPVLIFWSYLTGTCKILDLFADIRTRDCSKFHEMSPIGVVCSIHSVLNRDFVKYCGVGESMIDYFYYVDDQISAGGEEE